MKTYKDFGKVNLGCSDIASIVLRGVYGTYELHFGGDGFYNAYLVTEPADIGEHYTPVYQTKHWLWVYDDWGRRLRIRAEEITVYRAGDYGCIIYAPGITSREDF